MTQMTPDHARAAQVRSADLRSRARRSEAQARGRDATGRVHTGTSGAHPFAWLLLALSLLAFAGAGGAVAQEAPATASELEAFLDRRVPELLSEHGAPGASVAVVLPDGTSVARGFGLADVATGRRADADTPFAVGSVTKLLTWTAVMQQVEAGTLALRDPVEEHVAVDLRERYGEPLRIWHLMAHATGLEDRPIVGLIAREADDLPELGTFLAEQAPQQILAPGTLAAYSNYGTALAGHVVERIDGRSFADYVEQEILDPIGATDGTIRQPFPADLEARVARGYRLRGDDLVDVGPIWSTLPPAGSWWASADDAARFLRTWLNEGAAPTGARILAGETVRTMRSPLHRMDPRAPGNAHGWWEERVAGTDLISHGGSQPGFEAILSVAPEVGLGVSVAVNGPGGREVASTLRRELLAAFGPGTAQVPLGVQAGVDLERYVGTYQGTRYGTSTIARLGKIVQRLDVGRDGDALTFFGSRYLPVGDDRFVEENGDRSLLFLGDGPRARTFLPSDNPRQAYRRLAWHERGTLHAGVLLSALATLTLVALGWPRLTGRRRTGTRTPGRLAAAAALLTSVVAIGLLVVLLSDPITLTSQPGAMLRSLALTSLAALAATVVTTLGAIRVWTSGQSTLRARATVTAASLAALALVAVAAYWNVVGFAW